MNADRRDEILARHREAMKAQFNFDMGEVSAKTLAAADDGFMDFLYSLPLESTR